MQGPCERDVHELGENDDEQERLARRKRCVLSSVNWSRESSFNFTKLLSSSSQEIHDQIAHCLKLSAENKINEKNAFQLHMIDFLSYTLSRQNEEVSNLQMASACLDASSKIYGCRVDKVHLDLMKVLGNTGKGEKRGYDNGDNDYIEGNERQRKRRRKNYHIFSSVELLKGNLDTYNPLSLINTQNDVQTSDMLFQVNFPQHADQGIALNLYKDVLLDRVPSDKYNITKALITLVDDFTADHLCPSYADFKFLGWLPEDNLHLDQKSSDEDEDGEFHFNLDDPITDDSVNNNVMDYSNVTENSDRLVQNVQNGENIIDFQNIIANNPNIDCEYSYMELSRNADWNGPSYWKVKLKGNGNEVVKRASKKRNKHISLSFSRKLKESTCAVNYITRKRASINASKWLDEKNENSLNSECQDTKKFYEYFLKSGESTKLSENEITEGQNNDIRAQENVDLGNSLNLSKFDDEDNLFDADTTEEYDRTQQLEDSNNELMATSQEAFMGDNLVTVPSIVPKIFIPYSQRAKKIDMCKINKATEDVLQKMENNENIEFSKIYAQLFKVLPKSNAESLSAGLSFISLLHVAHKKNLEVNSQNYLCDLAIISHKKVDKQYII